MFDRLVWGVRYWWLATGVQAIIITATIVAFWFVAGMTDPNPLPMALGIGMGSGVGGARLARRSWPGGEALTVRERFAVFPAVRTGSDIGDAHLAPAAVSWANLKRYEAERAWSAEQWAWTHVQQPPAGPAGLVG